MNVRIAAVTNSVKQSQDGIEKARIDCYFMGSANRG